MTCESAETTVPADYIEKIAKLLRIAEWHPDTPEGVAAAELAQRLMERHGVGVGFQEEEEDIGTDRTWLEVGRYDAPDEWRNLLAMTIGSLYGIEFGWGSAGLDSDGVRRVALCMSDPQGNAMHLNSAIDHYRYVEAVVIEMTPPYSVPTRSRCMRLQVPRTPRVLSVFRCGAVDGISMSLIHDYDSGRVDVVSPDVEVSAQAAGISQDSDSVAMVRISKLMVRRELVPPAPDISIKHEPINDGILAAVYQSGVIQGQQIDLECE